MTSHKGLSTGRPSTDPPEAAPTPTPRLRQAARAKRFARGRTRVPGGMNATEAAYGSYLEDRKRQGEILWYLFDAFKLRLADKTFYTPDFAVMLTDGTLECHEVKGYWEDDARVKIKVAASMYPFRFLAVKTQAKKRGGGWQFEEF